MGRCWWGDSGGIWGCGEGSVKMEGGGGIVVGRWGWGDDGREMGVGRWGWGDGGGEKVVDRRECGDGGREDGSVQMGVPR